MLPRVIAANAISLDGRVDWFMADIARFYALAGRLGADAMLAGCDTLLNSAEPIPSEDLSAFEPRELDPSGTRPLLVVPDSRGRLRHWHALLAAGFWRDGLALCSESTPKDYLDYLTRRHISYIMAGKDHVDLRAALTELYERYGVRIVQVDSGGTLNGVLLRAGLVDEVCLLVHPALVGGTSAQSFYRAPDLVDASGVLPLRLCSVEQVGNGLLWLHYQVVHPN